MLTLKYPIAAAMVTPSRRWNHDSSRLSPQRLWVRVLSHIKKLDDCFGQFLVRVVCDCGACREIEPEALARLVGWSATLKELGRRLAHDLLD